jgi:hypothetical protein
MREDFTLGKFAGTVAVKDNYGNKSACSWIYTLDSNNELLKDDYLDKFSKSQLQLYVDNGFHLIFKENYPNDFIQGKDSFHFMILHNNKHFKNKKGYFGKKFPDLLPLNDSYEGILIFRNKNFYYTLSSGLIKF